MSTPKVSVLMPVYNGEKYLKDAIESILNQTFTDFEFIIINDGSKDSSAAIVQSYLDKRIVFVENEQNIGLIKTLNKGLLIAKGEYIVRMDCDDISLKNRIEVQVKFMDANPTIGACGSFYNIFINDKTAIADFPIDNEEMNCFLIFNSPIAHPTAIVRRQVLIENDINYSLDCIHAEDYLLWSQLAEKGSLANISQALLNYRIHPGQITETVAFKETKSKSLQHIRQQQLDKLGITYSPEELNIHNKISDAVKFNSIEELNAAQLWLIKLINFNAGNAKLNDYYFRKIVFERWSRLCVNFFGIKKGVSASLKSELYKQCRLNFKAKKELFCSFYNSWKRKKIR
jgi:glycosyltransferase involved in cell wall biosynthesis